MSSNKASDPKTATTKDLDTSMSEETLIRLNNIHVTFREREILTDISLDVKPGEIVTLIGPNGAGKTTLVRVVLGLQAPDSGSRTMKEGLRIGYMPQKLHVDESMPLSVKRFLSLTGQSAKQIRSALEKTGVAHVINSPVHSLSGGELQRTLLARALLNKPHLLVLDEPVQGVDVNGQKELYHLITELRNGGSPELEDSPELNDSPELKNSLELINGCSVLMVSHDLHLVMASTDRVVCLNQHLCCSGHPHQVRQHPAYLQLFGGESEELAVYTHHHDHEHAVDGHIIQKNDNGSTHA